MKNISKSRGHKSVDRFIITLCRGIASYISYLKIKNSSTILYESLLRIPISEISVTRDWAYTCEFKLKEDPIHKKDDSGKKIPGAYKKVDFVFFYYNQVIGIELKFEKGPIKKKQSFNILQDVNKLNNIFFKDSRLNSFKKKYSFEIVVYEGLSGNNLNYKGINIERVVVDSQTSFGNEKNLFDINDVFRTDSIIGGNNYIIVDAIKINSLTQ